jgi:hypothetical protein
MKELLRSIIKYTKLEPRYHIITDDELKQKLFKAGYENNGVNVRIDACIELKCLNKPLSYSTEILPLKLVADGDGNCIHDFITLYWETGSGYTMNGDPHSYKVCYKCGYHPSLYIRLKNFLRGN